MWWRRTVIRLEFRRFWIIDTSIIAPRCLNERRLILTLILILILIPTVAVVLVRHLHPRRGCPPHGEGGFRDGERESRPSRGRRTRKKYAIIQQ